jgi:hypothetical protein
VAIVGEMAIRRSFASRGSERREWSKKGLYYLLSMVIVYTYKGVNYFKCKNSKDLSSCSLV